ncbi:MAG: CARDB domain-containing protein [Candidatus Promineifilaceae bacterium]
MKSRSRIIIVVMGMVAALLVLLFSSPTAPWLLDEENDSIVTAKNIENSEDFFTNCRYGVSVTANELSSVSKLGAGVYLSFLPYPPSEGPANDAEFAHIIHIRQEKGPNGYLSSWYSDPPLDNGFANYISNNPGGKYLLGNEVDRKTQGETYPEIYALAYHDTYHFIKDIDPTAQIAISGLVEVTPMRTQYLDIVWDTYMEVFGTAIPVDIWNMHLYPIPEVVKINGQLKPTSGGVALGTDINLGRLESNQTPSDCTNPYDNIYCFAEHDDMDVFAEQVIRMRQWMKAHGQQNKPLIISEYSVLWPYVNDGDGCFLMDEFGNCFDPDRMSKFVTNSFDYLNNAKSTNLGYPVDNYRLVQQWVWYSAYQDPGATGGSSNLVEPDRVTLTKIGKTFRNYVSAETPYRNLVVDRAISDAVPAQSDDNATAQIGVIFRNNGNLDVQNPFNVTFYSNSGLTAEIGTVRINPEIAGCATASYEATVEWSGLSQGTHKFWVVIDSDDEILESPAFNNPDNIGNGIVVVYSDRLNLPLVTTN